MSIRLRSILLTLPILVVPMLSQAQSWKKEGSTIAALTEIYCTPIMNELFAISSSRFYTSTDSGAYWSAASQKYTGTVSTLGVYYVLGGKSSYALGTDSGLYAITNIGQLNQPLSSYPKLTGNITAYCDSNLVGTFDGKIYTLGATWSAQTLRLTIGGTSGTNAIVSLIRDGSGHSVAATARHGIWESRLNDSLWDSVSAGPNTNILRMLRTSEGYLVVLTADSGIMFSSGAGHSWNARNVGLPDLHPTCILISGIEALYAGTTNGVYRSNDYGQSWAIFNNGIDTVATVTAIAKDKLDNLFVALANGRTFTLPSGTVTSFSAGNINASRMMNSKSNLSFYVENNGILFSADSGNAEGMFWPRGSTNNYMFGGGVWFSAEHRIDSLKYKMCELSYNPNSGAGWFAPGEIGAPNDGADSISKYLNYASTHFNKNTGLPTVQSSFDPVYRWPEWQLPMSSHPLSPRENFDFGTEVSNTHQRDSIASHGAMPIILSDEDFMSAYSDNDSMALSQTSVEAKYPIELNFHQTIYSWGSGPYRDLIFVRYEVQNMSNDTLSNCYLAPALDPDLSQAQYNYTSSITSADSTTVETALAANPAFKVFARNPNALNMAYQWSAPVNGEEYGVLGIEFVETPVVSNGALIPNSDSLALGGYGPNSLYTTNQLGLTTFRQWTITNDPENTNQYYDFTASGLKDHDLITEGDMRMLLSTGPFPLSPGARATATIAIGIAHPSITSLTTNLDSLLRLMAAAHIFFADTTGSFAETGNPDAVILHHFANPQTTSGVQMVNPTLLSAIGYPNPTHVSSTIDFELPEDAKVSIALYDALGRRVATIIGGEYLSKGPHHASFDASKLPSGTYSAMLTAGELSQRTAVVVLH